MAYCPDCGTNVSAEDTFCRKCGRDLKQRSDGPVKQKAKPKSKSKDGTVSINVVDANSDADKRIYKVKNVAYTRIILSELTTFSKLLIAGIPLYAAILTFGFTERIDLALLPLIAIPILWLYFRPTDGLDIATLTETDHLAPKDPVSLESTFADRMPNNLVVKGDLKSMFLEHTYGCRFNPDNIVSVERRPGFTLQSIFGVGILAIGVSIIPLQFVVAPTEEQVSVGLVVMAVGSILTIFQWFQGSLVTGSKADSIYIPTGCILVLLATGGALLRPGAVTVATSLAIIYLLWLVTHEGDALRIRLGSGEHRALNMKSDDVNSLISDFKMNN